MIERLGEFQANQDEQELRIRLLEQNGARLKERVGLLGGALAVLQVILAAVAAAIGVRK